MKLILLSISGAGAWYLPGVAPKQYPYGSEVKVRTNKYKKGIIILLIHNKEWFNFIIAISFDFFVICFCKIGIHKNTATISILLLAVLPTHRDPIQKRKSWYIFLFIKHTKINKRWDKNTLFHPNETSIAYLFLFIQYKKNVFYLPGEVLKGDEITNSPYAVQMQTNLSCTKLCSKVTQKMLFVVHKTF